MSPTGCSTSASRAGTASRSGGARCVPRRARLLQGHLQPRPGRPRRRSRLAGPLAGRAGGGAGGASRPPARQHRIPELTRKALAAHGIDADIALSYGAPRPRFPTSQRRPRDRDPERAAGGRPPCDRDAPGLAHRAIANPAAAADPGKRHAMQQILTLLQGTLKARGTVSSSSTSLRSTSMRPGRPALHAGPDDIGVLRRRGRAGGGDGESDLDILIPALHKPGASDSLKMPLSGVRPLTVRRPAPGNIPVTGASPRSTPPEASARWPRTTAPPTASMPRRSPTGAAASRWAPQVTFTVAPGHGGLYEARSLVTVEVLAGSHQRPA